MVYNSLKFGRRLTGYAALAASSGSTLLDGLVSWWDLDEESGTRADAVGSNDLTDNNTVLYGAGKIGNAADFTATNNEYLSKTSPSGLARKKGWTLSAWYYPTTNFTNRTVVARDNASTQREYWLVHTGSAAVTFYYWNDADALQSLVCPAATLNSWNHILIDINEDGTAYAYLNNGTPTTDPLAGDFTDNKGAPFTIGARSNSSYHFDGLIDLVGIWSRSLTSDERTELYNLGASIKNPFTDNGEGFREGLVSYWKLDEQSGTREDSVGSNDLTDNNTVGYAAGKSGNAASGVTVQAEYLGVASPIGLIDNQTDFSVSCWVKWDSAQTGAARGFLEIGNAVNDSSPFLLFQKDTNDDLNVYWGGAYVGAYTASNGNWYHVVFTYNSTTTAWVAYVNGASHQSGSTADSNFNPANEFHLLSGYGNYFTGEVDEAAIWTRILSADEVAALYASGAGRFYDFQV